MKSKQGFTLIELLMVIAIIGLLTAIILVSFRVAPARANDVRIKTDINQSRTIAETIWADVSLYNSLCASGTLNENQVNYGTRLSVLEKDIAKKQGLTSPDIHCQAAGASYCVSARLLSNSNLWFCVDSTGKVVENASSTHCTATVISCP